MAYFNRHSNHDYYQILQTSNRVASPDIESSTSRAQDARRSSSLDSISTKSPLRSGTSINSNGSMAYDSSDGEIRGAQTPPPQPQAFVIGQLPHGDVFDEKTKSPNAIVFNGRGKRRNTPAPMMPSAYAGGAPISSQSPTGPDSLDKYITRMELQNVASAKINKPVKGILRPAKSLSDVVENGINNANRSAAKDPSSSRSVRFRDIPGDDESPTKAGKSPIKWGPTSYLPEYSYDQGKDFDAQGVYPPTACVFVANLPEPKDDMALEAAIVREFTKYGTVFVKIRRDAQNMPFAFCQFTRNEDANIAMEQGKGTMILGRPCRTEMVKANRSFVIYKRHGGDITVDEARLIMGPYGELSKCELLHTQVQEALGISPAVLAVFQKFDPTRDLNAAIKRNREFHIDAFDVKKKGVNSREDDRELLKQHEISCRSVYVTFLPADTDKREISDFFGQVGEVLNVDLIKKFVPSPQGTANRSYAFVEFSRPDYPDEAIRRFKTQLMRGFKLKVERKVLRNLASVPRRLKSQHFETLSQQFKTLDLKKKKSSEFSKQAAVVPGTPTKTQGTWIHSQIPAVSAAQQTQQSSNDVVVPTSTPVAIHAAPVSPEVHRLAGAHGFPQSYGAPGFPPMSPRGPYGGFGTPVHDHYGLFRLQSTTQSTTPSGTHHRYNPVAYNPGGWAGGVWPGATLYTDPNGMYMIQNSAVPPSPAKAAFTRAEGRKNYNEFTSRNLFLLSCFKFNTNIFSDGYDWSHNLG